MGKKSRLKAERRAEREGPLFEPLEPFAPTLTFAALDAASVSPHACHRMTSFAAIFIATTQHDNSGARAMQAADLQAIVKLAEEVIPEAALYDDYVPADIRNGPVVRWRDETFRIAPGGLERPLPMIARADLVSRAIDSELIPKLGFGLCDAVELILRRVDTVVAAVEELWSERDLPLAGSAVALSVEEIAAVLLVEPIESTVDSCSDSGRALAALRHYSRKPKSMSPSWQHPAWVFDTVIAAKRGGRVVPLPVGLLVEQIAAITADLGSVVSRGEAAGKNYRRTVAERLARMTGGAGRKLVGPVMTGLGPLHSIHMVNDRQLLAVEVVAELTAHDATLAIERANRRLGAIEPGVKLQTSRGEVSLPPNAQIQRLIVLASVEYLGSAQSLHPILPLEDIERIVSKTHDSHEDLWYFLRDLESPGVKEQFAFDMIDRWEVWKPRRSFHRGGLPVSIMFFAPHSASAEWEDAAGYRHVEDALAVLKLPPIRDWPVVSDIDEGRVELVDFVTDQSFDVLPWPIPVSIQKLDAASVGEHFASRWKMAECVTANLQQVRAEFEAAMMASGNECLTIGFAFAERDEGPALTTSRGQDDRIDVVWDSRLSSVIQENSFVFEELLGECIAEFFETEARPAFINAWNATPPGIRVDVYSVPQLALQLDDPAQPSEPVRNDTLIKLGLHLKRQGIKPQTFSSDEAKRIESAIIFPWLIEQLWRTARRFDRENILRFALIQQECANSARYMEDLKIGWQAGFALEDGPEDRRVLQTVLSRTISLILEEVLGRPHDDFGERKIDVLAWRELVTIASECFASCARSDEIHFGIGLTNLDISDLYEVNTVDAEESPLIDIEAYSKSRNDLTAPSAVPIVRGVADVELQVAPSENDPVRVRDIFPDLEDVDDAMEHAMGFGLDSVFAVLGTAARWNVDNDDPIVLVDPVELVEACRDAGANRSEDELGVAVSWLTLTASGLTQDGCIKHWENERRADRVGVKPLVEDDDGRVWVLPWTAGQAVSILKNYLEDGRLPWPMSALPRDVENALKKYRQERNRQLELDCVDMLQQKFEYVVGGLTEKKAAKLGVTDLSGEIDALVIDEKRSRIWVLEVKDPYASFSIRQIRKRVDDFHKDNGYNSKLRKKVEDIQRSAKPLAVALGIYDPVHEWDVRGVMLTRHLNPAAFHPDAEFPFCWVETVNDLLDSHKVPGTGHHGAKSS